MWPPSHPADLQAELVAGMQIREQLDQGIEVDLLEEQNLPPGDHPNLFVTEGRVRGFDYLEVIFGNIKSPDERLPLVVLIHGRGDRPRIPSGSTQVHPPVRVFIPRGPDPLGSGFHWLATCTRSNDTELLVRSLAPRADQLAQAIVEFARLRPTRGKPVIAGFSQGAIMTYGIYARHPEVLRAAFPIAGWLAEEMDPTSATPRAYPRLQALHGSLDRVVPTDLDVRTVARLRGKGYPATLTLVPGVAHEVTDGMNTKVRQWIANVLAPQSDPERHRFHW